MFSFFFSIEAGVAFKRGSHLELQTPAQLKELAVNTHIRLYFNVTGMNFIFFFAFWIFAKSKKIGFFNKKKPKKKFSTLIVIFLLWVGFLLLFDLLQKTIIFKPFFAINDKEMDINPSVKNPQNCIFLNQFCWKIFIYGWKKFCTTLWNIEKS